MKPLSMYSQECFLFQHSTELYDVFKGLSWYIVLTLQQVQFRQIIRNKYVMFLVNSTVAGKTLPAFPAHAQTAILRIWQEAHGVLS